MADASMLALFMYKRHEYGDEREVRALLSLRMAEEFGVTVPTEGVEVALDVEELIEVVRLSPASGQDDVQSIESLIRSSGMTIPVELSTLTRRPKY
jgi:hypothetical protein